MGMTPHSRTGSQKSRAVSQVVAALIAGRDISPQALYSAIAMSRGTYYGRLDKGDWKVSELADIAEFFDVPISVFFDGMGGLFTGDTKPGSGRDTHEDMPADLLLAAA